MLKYLSILFFCCLWSFQLIQAQCDNNRYVDKIFDEVQVTTGIQYGSNINANNFNINLFFDVYEPVGDTIEERPVIILNFGGSFIGGSRSSEDIVFFCNELAQRGYVAIAADYRLEPSAFSLIFAEAMTKAVMRAVQDGKAMVRYLRHSAENGNHYKINPDQIFMGGVSSGAILSMHVAYMNEADELPANWAGYIEELGGWEGDSGTPGYPSHINGVISFAGALGQPHFLDEGDVPIINFHSTGDGTVPYGIGPPFGFNTLPDLYGSSEVQMRADEVGVISELHTFEDSNHPHYLGGGFDGEKMTEAMEITSEFLIDFVTCPPDIPIDTMMNDTMMNDTMVNDTMMNDTSITAMNHLLLEQTRIYPNPSMDIVYVKLPMLLDGQVNWALIDPTGRTVQMGNDISSSFTINRKGLATGLYILQLHTPTENHQVVHRKIWFK